MKDLWPFLVMLAAFSLMFARVLMSRKRPPEVVPRDDNRGDELREMERRLREREASIDERARVLAQRDRDIEKRASSIADNERVVDERLKRIDERVEEARRELERVSGMSAAEARDALRASIEGEARELAAKRLREIDKTLQEESKERAARLLSEAMQRQASAFVAETTVAVVDLPNDEMKGRIIGREGRNIRALEAATGADVIIDDTPEAVVVSAFNPVRRHVAKTSLERLVADGRIHPARIEEIVGKVTAEVNETLIVAGEQAVNELGLTGVHPELIKLLGRLKHHVVGGQNVLTHSLETAMLTGALAAELGMSATHARRAGLLHDVGKAVGHEGEGHHADVGADLAARYGERPDIVRAIRTHHDTDPDTVLGTLVYVANVISKTRPGARRDQIDSFIKRASELEKTAMAFEGVEKVYAVQAGREVRVLVDFARIDDAKALVLSQDIARKIQDELTYPGEVRVTVVREARATEIAR
ncbi:MAG: ribonuclease Y [Myxococcota bacterium]